jgi:hypothetical protein
MQGPFRISSTKGSPVMTLTRSPVTLVISAVAALGLIGSVAGGFQANSKSQELAENRVTLTAAQSALTASQANVASQAKALGTANVRVERLGRSVKSAERETRYVEGRYLKARKARKAAERETTLARFELARTNVTVQQLRTCAGGLAGVALSIIDEDYEAANAKLDAIKAPCDEGAAGAKAANGGV